MAMPPPPPPPLYPATAGGKPERKTVERNRRNQMNALYYRLDTLVRAGGAAPSPPAAATRPDRLGEAAAYISRTAERVERLKDRKRELTAARAASTTELGTGSGSSSGAATVMVEVQHLGSGLHGILVTGAPPSDGSMFHRAVRAVEEAGGEVQNAHFSVVGARAVYTIHTLVGEQQGSIERVVQRLKETVRGLVTL
uniref:BHLH domain-containing protein n=1 Tax=Aegilops tauschii subsp. strangulata TaxID=200361 RepID=A0A453M9M8_AEGTS